MVQAKLDIPSMPVVASLIAAHLAGIPLAFFFGSKADLLMALMLPPWGIVAALKHFF